MGTKNLKVFAVLTLIFIFTFTLIGCDLVKDVVKEEAFSSTVTIEGIEEDEHTEHFTLSEDFADSSVTFTAADVEAGTVSHTFTDLEGEVEISLAIDNQAIEDGYYAEVDPVTVDIDDPDVTFALDWTAVEPEAAAVTLSGETEVTSYQEDVTETYTAELDIELAGVPVTLNVDNEEAVEIAESVVETDAAGAAEFEVTFLAEQDAEIALTASIDEADEGVGESASYSLAVVVDTDLEGNIANVLDTEPLEVPFGTEFEDLDLPEEVEVVLDDEDETIFAVSVAWDEGDYDGEEAGTYTLQGELVDLPKGITNEDELMAEIEVTVLEMASIEFNVSPESIELDVGESEQLNVDVTEPEENYSVDFTSANESIATVDGDGLVTAVSGGSTSIEVTVEAENYESASETVSVTVEAESDRVIIELDD